MVRQDSRSESVSCAHRCSCIFRFQESDTIDGDAFYMGDCACVPSLGSLEIARRHYTVFVGKPQGQPIGKSSWVCLDSRADPPYKSYIHRRSGAPGASSSRGSIFPFKLLYASFKLLNLPPVV